PHRRHGVVDQKISEHRVAEGPADERCHHRVSQGRVPLSQPKVRKILDTTGVYSLTRSAAFQKMHSGRENSVLVPVSLKATRELWPSGLWDELPECLRFRSSS